MQPATHRDQLITMLAEAAEIEHCLMCTYLYAAFSLKQGVDEDLLEHELSAVKRWRAEIIAIATEEMLHLALVNNLLMAVGSRPHYRHFNFPALPGQFPADVAVALLPFDAATLDHFIYVERPRETDETDGADIDKAEYSRDMDGANRVSEISGDYDTVGELYQSIADSLAPLATSLGEEGLFVGAVAAQLTEKDVFLPGLCAISTVAQATTALGLIVEQGEGSRVCHETSHYARFRTIRQQWQALSSDRPAFKPYRDVARNPVMRSPVTTEERVQIVSEPAISLLDVGNSSYFLMLRLLALMSDTANCRLPRAVVVAQATTLMHALADVGVALTGLPASPAHPGVRAGLTFSLTRTAFGYESPVSAAKLISERMELLATHAQQCVAALPALELFAKRLRDAASAWRGASDAQRAQEADRLAPAASPESTHDEHVDVIRGEKGTIYFNAKRCIHSRHCVLGEPEVFRANREGDWIFPDAATAERVNHIALNCVSGAIRFERHDGGENEVAPKVNQIRMRENGPLSVNAEVTLVGADGGANAELRVTLCRCGKSKNKPFCDQSHIAAGFVSSGEAVTRPSPELERRDGPLVVTPLRDGPLDVRGSAEICTGTRRTIDRTMSVRLCRCGQSADKPFCDGSHRAANFEAAGRGS
ncbi:ferritin-like domain-containing protein [Scleromatobacter humisilvae]|uniref:CDGSH iron-sulfur domain-containing protein n=1 Tax=Scleromatobacter humisilvae TaxID=2897159 RepID=A0A9X2C1H0_9BURK|nr:ferritin-like domain-containing protein [Scleromatobacter humisilvae]MCK9684980.1 CDGSH iron-sulfur domain-containing protein [Scleromatobacter humisilvae]